MIMINMTGKDGFDFKKHRSNSGKCSLGKREAGSQNTDEYKTESNPQKHLKVQSSFYKITKKTNDLSKYLESVKETPHQHTASSYHPIEATSWKKDKLLYRRNQLQSEELLSKKIHNFPKKNPYNFGLARQFPDEHFNTFENKNESDSPAKTKNTNLISSYKNKLDDRIIEHKNENIKKISDLYNENTDSISTHEDLLLVDENQKTANYPCLIVRFNENHEFYKKILENNITNEDEAFAKFVNHVLLAYINNELILKNQEPLFDRRQSFGFLTPTGSDVGTGVRLSLGLVPNKQWCQCIVDGIKKANTALENAINNKGITQGIKYTKKGEGEMGSPYSKFNKGNVDIYGHKILLEMLLSEDETKINAFKTFLTNVSNKMYYSNAQNTYQGKDGFKELLTKINKKLKPATKIELDKEYEDLYKGIMSVYQGLNSKNNIFNSETCNVSSEAINAPINDYKYKSLENAYNLSEIEKTSAVSDSDSIFNPEDKAKNYSTCGMSALYFPLEAYHKTFTIGEAKEANNKITSYIVEDYAYFELNGWKNKKMEENWFKHVEKSEVSLKDRANSPCPASVIFIDNNPCVNGPGTPRDTIKLIQEYDKYTTKPDLLIIDDTSSTTTQRKAILTEFKKTNIKLLVFASSGLKNMQLGLDNAQFGKIKTYVNSKGNPDEKCKKFIEELIAFSKNTMCAYSRYVNREMRNAVTNVESNKSTQFSTPGNSYNSENYLSSEGKITAPQSKQAFFSSNPARKESQIKNDVGITAKFETQVPKMCRK